MSLGKESEARRERAGETELVCSGSSTAELSGGPAERGWGARSSGPCKGNNTGNDKLRQEGDRGPEKESDRDLNRLSNHRKWRGDSNSRLG